MTAENGFLETDGARIHYEVEGSGDPVLFIHAGIANLRMWDDQAAALLDRYRVIRYDTRGYGETETEAVSFSNRADEAAVLDHLGEASAHVVGLSRGAVISLDFTLERPDRVRSLTVAAGGISGNESPDEVPEGTWAEPERLEEAKDWTALADWETAYWVDGPGQPRDRVPAALRDRVHGWILDTYLAEKVAGTPQPLDPPAWERLDDLRVPLLVMVGTVDDPGTRDSMRQLASRVAWAQLEVFDGAAHMLNLEQPERFTRVLRQFLDEVSARTG